MRVVTILAAMLLGVCAARAETIQVLGRGTVDLQHFICENAPHSAIRRVCYDEENQYMIIQLGSLYFHHCSVEAQKVYGLLHAKSVARYFNSEIRGRYTCNSQTMPAYN
jgi:hypothetical protein